MHKSSPKGPGVASEAFSWRAAFFKSGTWLGELISLPVRLAAQLLSMVLQNSQCVDWYTVFPALHAHPLPLPMTCWWSGCVLPAALVPPGIFAIAGSSSFGGETLRLHKHAANIISCVIVRLHWAHVCVTNYDLFKNPLFAILCSLFPPHWRAKGGIRFANCSEWQVSLCSAFSGLLLPVSKIWVASCS